MMELLKEARAAVAGANPMIRKMAEPAVLPIIELASGIAQRLELVEAELRTLRAGPCRCGLSPAECAGAKCPAGAPA
jgi:hypothetical protein